MNLDELKTLWNSSANIPTAETKRVFIDAAIQSLTREQAQARGMSIYVIGMTVATTGFSAWQLLRAKGEGIEAWYAHLMLAATWVAAISMATHYKRRMQAIPAAANSSIRVTLETLLDHARSRYRETQILLGLFVSFIPLLAIAISQLQASGKMRPHEASSAATVAGVILTVGIGWFLFDLIARKRPELRHIQTLLREYQS